MATNNKIIKPSDTLSVTINSEVRELFMSFGLLNQLTNIIQSPERVATLPMELGTRMEVISAVVAKRKKSGKIEEDMDMDDIDISLEDAESIVGWVQEHVLGFFVRSLQRVTKVAEMYQEEATNLASSGAGLASLVSKKP